MRARFIRLVGILMVLGSLVVPAAAGASAAPAIAATPTQTPPGGTVTVAGIGFAPGAKLAVYGKASVGTARVKQVETTAGADGAFTAAFRVAGFYPAGALPIVVTSLPDGAELAQATVTVTDAPSVATEKLTLNQTAGPVGTVFSATGEGFAPGTRVVFHTTESAKQAAGTKRVVADIRIPADGRVAFTIDTAGYSPENHDLVCFTDGTVIGYPLTRSVLALTPGLPSTGGGGAARSGAGWLLSGWALAGLLIVALGGCGAIAARQRGAAR